MTSGVKYQVLNFRLVYSDSEICGGQVAQLVERSPEKAGVGGATPSLATISFSNLATQPEISHL